ncbi:MAG: 23S rRNA (guanosine(2251)-2'-O)-methyltransferase RlmB [Schleiferiaceae bacterium]|nr:23S rRNA (guanosine(2251)-2'-O)-methyltransferase RlmB [Schleiferiaceae bacterium]
MIETNNSECNNLPIFGIRPIIEAIESGKEIDRVLIQKGLRSPQFSELWHLIKEHQIPFRHVPVEKIKRLTSKNHQGVVAYLSPISLSTLDQILPTIYESGKDPLILVLDRVTDVGNFGAIVRTAEVCGVNAVVIPEKGSAPLNGDAVKTSAGALLRVPICREKRLRDALQQLQDSGIRIIACTEKSDTHMYQVDLSGPLAIVMGSEDDGVSDYIMEMSSAKAAIPMLGKIGSLNVSVSAGVVLYESLRQRAVGESAIQ